MGLWPPQQGFSEEEAEAIHTEFMVAPECCLDTWFSIGFRKKLRSVADFKLPHVQQILQVLSRSASATNMGLEGLLSMVKASVRSGKAGPTAEKLVYSGLLTQLMHDHKSCGRRDSRSVSQAVRDPDGLPLDRRPGQVRKRPDQAWKGAYLTWCRQHPSASLEDKEAMQVELQQKFPVLEASSVFLKNMVHQN